MKIALQLHLIALDSVADQVLWAKDHGVEGIEISAPGNSLENAKRQADEILKQLPLCSVCGNGDPESSAGSFDFLDPDKEKRRASLDASTAWLKFCGEVGAAGQIVPPIFGGPRVPDLSPVVSVMELQDKLMLAACEELGAVAADAGTLFMLEPLNRYEQHYLRRQADAVRILKQCGKGVGLLSDFFHMHIEELSIPAAFAEFGCYTSHVHLADNTRMEPGSGDIDFTAAFAEMNKHHFGGFMSYECGVRGGSAKERLSKLAESLEFIHSCVKKSRTMC